jgi:hypothetical protein
MLTRAKIDLGENFCSSQLIKKNINSEKRIFVFDGQRIESTYNLKLPSFFLIKSVGQPQGEKIGWM